MSRRLLKTGRGSPREAVATSFIPVVATGAWLTSRPERALKEAPWQRGR